MFTGIDIDNVRNMFFDADAGGDILLFIRSLTVYVILRLVLEVALSGKIKGYTMQQYVVTIIHQAIVLPACMLGWSLEILEEGQAPILIYVLTGAHMLSDSIVNYTPVSACVAGTDGPPVFSWGVHAHHLFTLVLCLIGTTLPSVLVDEGAVCILLGELGSLWITITMLWPTALNFAVRLLTFASSRFFCILIALDILRQLESLLTRLVMLCMMVGLCIDNWTTLHAMYDSSARSRYAAGAEHSSLKKD